MMYSAFFPPHDDDSSGLGVASRSIRRRRRVHGISIEVLRKCPWSYFEDKFRRNFDITVASNWEGKGLPLRIFEDPILTFLWQTAQAETNNPQWGKAIETIYPKAREMMSKPRYWQVAFPLVIISLCVAPQSYFLKHWQSCFEHAVSKLKVKSHTLQREIISCYIRKSHFE